MGKKTSRLELRRQVEAAEKLPPAAKVPRKKKAAATVDGVVVVKKKAVKKARVKKSKVPVFVRLRMLWAVYDNSNQVKHKFAFNDRAGADKYAEEQTAKGKGAYFVQPLKEPIEEVEEETPAAE